MLKLIQRISLGFLVVIAAILYIEISSDPMKRPSFLIWPDNKPTLAQTNQPPITLGETAYIKNEWYFYGGAAGGSFSLLSICKEKSCSTLLQAVGILAISQPSLNSKIIEVRGLVSEEGPSNFTVLYPRHCKPKQKTDEMLYSWTCQFRDVAMNLHYAAIKPKPRIRYTLDGVPKDKITETIVGKPKP
jgi:hypothetical protein